MSGGSKVPFNVICSFVVDILYEKAIVNNLFSFDLSKKNIIIKNGGNKIALKHNNENNEIKSNDNSSQINQQPLPLDHSMRKKKMLIEYSSNSELNNKNSGNSLVNNNKRKARNINETYSYKKEYEINSSENNSLRINLKTGNMKESKISMNLKKINQKDLFKEKKNNQMVNSIELNNYLIHLCFCFVRNRKNKNNVFLDEAVSIISEKLDILNLFRNICLQENAQRKLGYEHEMIKMSEECIKSLRDLKIKYGIFIVFPPSPKKLRKKRELKGKKM